MSDRPMTPPPAQMGGGVGRAGRGRPVEKPKDLRGTLARLWRLTQGRRKGLGWILLLSALTSVSADSFPAGDR